MRQPIVVISKFKIVQVRKKNMLNEYNRDRMLTTRQVADMLNVHINTVRRWNNQGVLKAYRVSSRRDRRFRQSDVDDFLSKQLPDNNS